LATVYSTNLEFGIGTRMGCMAPSMNDDGKLARHVDGNALIIMH